MTDTIDNIGKDFIRQIIIADNASGKHDGNVVTRFPPEPNGYLHIGHVMSICLNFGIAEEFNGRCYLRFDDTNPVKEDQDFVDSIMADVHWLGFDWEDRLTHAADYFEDLYSCAVKLIEDGKAYVDSLSAGQIREYRGTLTEPGKDSPHRDRSVEENLDLFRRMRAGEFDDGAYVLRARIDMAAPNMNLRDPALYRIRKINHQQTGNAWSIYPMYDFAHTVSDALEGITHSLCTLEFEDHRPLYEWILDNLDLPNRPRQIEFSRLNVAYGITSKRKLAALIEGGFVSGWDDPRMPTVAGMRRRGYTPQSIRNFVRNAGVTKKDKLIEMGALENCVREDLNQIAPRAMAVLNPLKVVFLNHPQGEMEMLPAMNHPNNPELGVREIPFGREIFIERDDFMEDPPRKFFRLRPGGEVRLRYAYIIKCVDVIKNDAGEILEVHCTYDPDTKSGRPGADRKVKGTIHWVSADESVTVEVRLFDRMFTLANPDANHEGKTVADFLNPDSLNVVSEARVEPALVGMEPGTHVQFERLGYFLIDTKDSQPGQPVFNRVVTLRDSWAKIEKAQLAEI
ncbi:MAG TPA: glutamine--tRNA ligase/YqeY domain fusion protein [Gammaproteobacteria bacterium]|jgi:glutaminyl-tRNA synthetase|nr:glutamine--tRNA ligase [Chromatiales bacterium]MCP4927125.1 glutamine--tRNA ligase/YqeY domain fusion protein [Gammaproteobacteria bacterium]MDP7661378.1 glutamine--tRNA ligase/YqeY domain fusion protein [Gammaproteobacteria bacterium]HJP38909.1 glutamine--tRNA ligase/YqeY domain fusion protein [Gammaproteobacteria bacterium]